MIESIPSVKAMAAYALADLGDVETVSLAQNESAFPASPAALAAGRAAMEQAHLYPDPDWSDLRTAIAERHGLSAGQILCGAGSMELIGCLVRAYAGPGRQVLGTEFGYAYVASAAAQAQAEYLKAPELGLTVSVDRILDCVTEKTSIVFVCNPGNPTGTLLPNSEIIRLREKLPGDVLLVVDQAYAEFADAQHDPSEIFALVEQGNTVVTRTFSKAYALAGARVGWGCFPLPVAREVRKLLNPNNVSVASQAMAAAAMRDGDYTEQIVRQSSALRDRFAVQCRELGLEVPESHTNFVLIRFPDEALAKAADSALRQEKLLMRGMGGYGLSDCLRATVCREEIMEQCVRILREVLS
ncbi:pyridoxal phosphate-dependent aminotransferase [Kiloniella sp. b19]|uniref:pyridoxal phosphate-dependent aminotransferase n=1 Tax=Kiloniella sp. GXU_MW_B19 TaxID=3141326 RepID=UPI0031E118AA